MLMPSNFVFAADLDVRFCMLDCTPQCAHHSRPPSPSGLHHWYDLCPRRSTADVFSQLSSLSCADKMINEYRHAPAPILPSPRPSINHRSTNLHTIRIPAQARFSENLRASTSVLRTTTLILPCSPFSIHLSSFKYAYTHGCTSNLIREYNISSFHASLHSLPSTV
ncbi:hypothetical protein BDN70DRAFT_557217 [Pholiota conissans]|uniref:Uncharacterized protein n=1 Tax=Pholiota conissans TaxID=109636 RepID=A0A9P5YN24_9AGAR|nr:hypothetical protein BDN70DRAFT_557217 [Pholiota conissans]